VSHISTTVKANILAANGKTKVFITL